MLCFKVFTIFVIALCLMPEQAFGHFWWKKCFIKKCSNYGSPVYTTENNKCLIFPNSCYLKNENCRRRGYEPSLTQVTLAACQKLCPKDCAVAEKKDEVCGNINGVHEVYKSECDLEKTACEKGLPYHRAHSSFCS